MTMPKNKCKTKHRKPFFIAKHNSILFAYKNHAYSIFKPQQKCFKNSVINTIISDYEIMLSHYSRVFVVRIDLHPKHYSADNQAIKRFLKQLTTTLTNQYKSKVIYHCAREQNTSDREHYHLALMLSAHKIKHSERLQSLIKAMWEKHSGGTVAKVDNPYCIVFRGNKASLKHAIYRSSYLAKEHTKELNGKAKGFISNKLQAAKTFDPTNDFMLVDPKITFAKKQHQQSFQAAQASKGSHCTKTHKSAKYSWFNIQSHALQLEECISSRTTSLNHLTKNHPRIYQYKETKNLLSG